MQANKNTKLHKAGTAIGKAIAHLLLVVIVWLLTYGYLTVTSYIFCFEVSLRSSTAASSLILIIHYTNYFAQRKKAKPPHH